MIVSKDSTPEQKEALRQALRQHSLQMAVRGATPEGIESLPEDFEPPSYSENTRPLYDGQLFPQIVSADDLIANGYATPDGQPTEQGKMAISLKKVGALNDDYTLNQTGRAMLSNRADLLKPENLSLYGKSEELNLDDDGRGAMARFSLGAQELWNSTKNLGAALYEEAEPALGVIKAVGGLAKGPAGVVDVISGVKQQLETDYSPEQRSATRIRTEEALKEFSDQGAYTLLGAGELMMRGAMASPVGITGGSEVDIISQAQKDENILATRQARERVLNDAANVSVSEAVDQLTGVTEFVKSYQQAAELLGPERTKELQAQGKAVGLAASILNPATPEAAAFGVGFKAARGITAPISGALLRAEQKASRVLAKTEELTALQKQAADYQFAIKTVEQQAARAEETAARLSKRGFVERANSQMTSANAIRRKAQEAGVKLGGLNDEIARVSDDLATLTKDATVADKFNQMLQKAKEVPYMPITVVGQGLERVGRGMIGIDKGLSKLASKIGVDKAYNAMNKITSLSGLGAVGSVAGLGPVAFIPAAIKTAWSTAPFIQGAGRFINLVGKEAMKARADIDFWKRIYAMPNQGPVNRAIAGLMDTVTLGGRVTDFGVRTTKGILAAVPADLAFQYVAEGGKMDAGSIGEALSESVFFGGAGGGLGAITMGSKQKIRSLQNGNALNFYRTLEDPQQRILFNGMPEDYRRAIGTFSATNPGARVMFTTIGGGGIDPNTNTIYINPNSSNPIKPMVTHEFMHHMVNNGIGEAIVAQLVGDGYQTGGILRTADGKYEPQYEAFKEEYVDRLRQQHAQMIKMREAVGDKIPASEREFQPPSEKYLAEEYFIENNVDDMLGLVESGKLGKMAGRMIINDKVRALGDAILNKSSILRDLHFKLGGVMDKNGKMVSGNGFLGGTMYQSPEIRRMFKKMVSDSVGRKGGFDKARVKAKEGVKLKITSKTDPILRSMASLWEGDADGVPFLDKDGDYIPLKKETEEMRATAGLLLIDDQNRRQANGETIAEGQLVYNPDTQTWSGKYLTDDQIRILRLSGRFNNPQIRQLEMLNEAAKATLDPNAAPETRGNRFSIIYQAALKRNKKGKWRYDQIEPSLRDVVPYGVEITKNGNILIRIMSTNQMHANISQKAASKKGVQLYEGNIEAILRDVNKVIELHGEKEGKPTDAHFKEKYGAEWETYKSFINSIFGNVGAGHKDINPLVATDKVDAVVKTYRLDRINKATQMVGSTNLPYQNNLVKINYLPEGEPILDANGEPKDLRYTPSMPEAQRAMPEGISPEDLNPVANAQEAQGRWADGKRMFAINEMDEKLIPITSKAMLDSYPADAIGWMEPEAAPAGEQAGKMRFMPEGEKATPAEVIQELETTNFIPKKVAAEILGQFPDYLKPVANFIAAQRQKLVAGKITARDLWKSYAMTVASQGTGAVSVDLLKAKLAKEGIDFSPEKLFTDVNKSGVETIRPEEAAAYWLGTEAGKTALDNVEAGEFNASDWEGLVKIRKAYGDDRFKTFNVFSDKNIERIPSVIEKLNNSKGDPKQVLDAVQLLNGVSTGKKGFISHLLGLGNTPTIDAVEINFWLTGKGDVGTIKSKEADLARKIKSTFSDKRVSQAVFNRINDSINDLRSVATGANQVPKEAWSHVMHHWLWDKAKGLETTHAGMYEAQMRFMPEKLDSDYMKAVEVGDVEAQQRMVDEAAKRAGYKQGVLWHGSRGKKFTVFDETKGDRLPWMEGHVGHYFSPDKNIASAMGSNVLGAYLKMDNPLILDAGDYSYSAITPARKKEIQKQGYDSVIGTPQTNAGKQEFIVFDSNQIKSADPITRDNSGKVIPLSKRFDVGSKDIRYMPEGDGINDAVKIARQKLDNIRNSRKESSINWELDKDRLEEEGVKFYITDINLPKDDQYIKQFLPLESIIQGDDKKWYFGDSFGFDTLEDAKDFASDKIKNSLKDFSTSSTFGSDMDAKEVASSIFDAFPKHPSIIKDWNSSKWGSWYLEFKDKNQNKQKISVRDHSASRSDMGLPEKSFYVSKLWNPEEIGVALNDAFEYIQDNGVSRNNEKPKKKSTAKGNSSAIANASKLK